MADTAVMAGAGDTAPITVMAAGTADIMAVGTIRGIIRVGAGASAHTGIPSGDGDILIMAATTAVITEDTMDTVTGTVDITTIIITMVTTLMVQAEEAV